VLVESHAQRLAREALFLLVYGPRAGVREVLLQKLGAAVPAPDTEAVSAPP
jgi:hypothetical protein